MAFSPESALQHLQRAHKQNRLAHAYLISGPVGSGKSTVAARFAAALNKTTPEDVLRGQAPDIFITEPASRSRRIVVEQIRNLERALQLRTSDQRTNIAVKRAVLFENVRSIMNFVLLSAALAVNLSCAGERGGDVAVQGTADSVRTAAAHSSQLSAEEKQLLRSLCAIVDEEQSRVERAYDVSQAIQRLLDSIREGIKAEHAEALKSEETRYRNTTDGAWLAEREDYYKALSESMYRERRSRLIETLFLWWADVLRAKVGASDRHLVECEKATTRIGQGMTTAEVLKRIRRLEELRDHLNTTAQEALVLEVACLSVFR